MGRLHAVIKRQFGLDEETTDELVAEATAAEHDAIDLYHFTTLINRSLEEDGRRRVVEMMWEMVYADGHVSEFERNLIRERTRAGLASARARGRKGGRPPKLGPKELREIRVLLRDPGVTVSSVAKRYGVSRVTLYAHLNAAAKGSA